METKLGGSLKVILSNHVLSRVKERSEGSLSDVLIEVEKEWSQFSSFNEFLKSEYGSKIKTLKDKTPSGERLYSYRGPNYTRIIFFKSFIQEEEALFIVSIIKKSGLHKFFGD